jgi:magnesium transporter
MSSETTQPLSPPTPPTPRGPLLAPSHHRTSSTLQRHLETALAPATLNKRSASVTDQIELEEWWSLTPERLRRIFKEVDVDNDGRLPFACLVDSLRRYDLAAQEQDVTDTLTKLRSPSSDGEDDFARAWRRKSTTEVTEEEFLQAAKQLMVAKVFAAARRKQAPRVSLVDFGLDDIEIGDDVQVTKAWLALPQKKRTRWVEIRGDETALRLLGIEYALHPLALEDALRPSQRPKEERYETHAQIVVPRFVVHGDAHDRVATENVSIFVSGESLVTYAASTQAPAWSRRVRAELACSFTKLREEGSNFLAYRVLDAVLDSGPPAVAALRGSIARQRIKLRRSKYSSNDAGATLQRIKCDLEQILRLLRPLARVLMTLVQDDDVVDHRYNSYIEDAGENVAELEDDIAAALGDIERLAEESELYFQRSQEKTIYVLTTVTAIFLPLQFVTGLFGMNFKYMPQLNDRGAYYLLLWICLIYTVLALALVWWCSSGRRRSLKHHDIEAA